MPGNDFVMREGGHLRVAGIARAFDCGGSPGSGYGIARRQAPLPGEHISMNSSEVKGMLRKLAEHIAVSFSISTAVAILIQIAIGQASGNALVTYEFE